MHESQYDLAQLRAATDAAHAFGLPITAHAHGPQGVADAVAAGVDGVEHASFRTDAGVEPDWRTVARFGSSAAQTRASRRESRMACYRTGSSASRASVSRNCEALASATSRAAAACGLEARKGRLAPGYDADILAVAGDPTIDIRAVLNVRAVFRAGRRVALESPS